MERATGENGELVRKQIAEGRESARNMGVSPWLSEALFYGLGYYASVITRDDSKTFQRLDFANATSVNGWARDIMHNLGQLNGQIINNPSLRSQLTDTKNSALLVAAKEMKKRNDYSVIPQLMAVITANNSQLNNISHDLAMADLLAIYLLACQEDKFLIGTRDGDIWKQVNLPPLESPEERLEKVLELGRSYYINLGLIGRREAPLVPDNPISPEKSREVNLPTPARSPLELLEDAYFHQRYIVPTDGAEVRFKKAGSLQKMKLIQSRNILFANMQTDLGDALVVIDTDTGVWLGPSSLSDQTQDAKWASILAEVYHDLVTADEVSTTRFRRLKTSRGPITFDETEDSADSPSYIYIPRKVKVGEDPAPRLPYSGPVRPVRPHEVTGYPRLGRMTQEQRINILDLERELGIDILRFVPDGKTFVRPHVSPKEARSGFRSLPIFIKRRIETQLQRSLQRVSVKATDQDTVLAQSSPIH